MSSPKKAVAVAKRKPGFSIVNPGVKRYKTTFIIFHFNYDVNRRLNHKGAKIGEDIEEPKGKQLSADEDSS
jgi:hypothetical protein